MMNNTTSNNDSRQDVAVGLNQVCYSYDIMDTFAVRMTTSLAFAGAFNILIGVVAVFLNSLLLCSLVKINRAALHAKELVAGLCVANCCFPVLTSLNPGYLGAIFGLVKDNTVFCLATGYTFLVSTLFIVQPLCVAGLACDRIYAVTKPFQYNAVGYGRMSRIFLSLLPWAVATVVWMYFLLSVHESMVVTDTSPHWLCRFLAAAHFDMEGTYFIDVFYIAVSTASFVIYMLIFGFLKYQRWSMKKLSLRSEKTQHLSVTLAYFLSNITTLALYLPAPLHSVLVGGALRKDASEESKTTFYILSMLNVISCCVDPLILIKRIPAIRKNLPIKSKAMVLSSAAVSTGDLSVGVGQSGNFQFDVSAYTPTPHVK